MNDARRVVWRKSSHSTQEGGQCVEMADLEADFGIRDSVNPAGPALVVGRQAIASLINRIKAGELDR